MIARPAGRLTFALLLGLAACAMPGCGSGGGSSSGGRSAGIEGTGITSGFGSVYVGGIEFATDDAEILFDGERVGEQALRVGDVVRVSGTVDDDGQGHARRIVFEASLKGPIEAIDRQGGTRGELRVLGQRVHYDANTHFVDTDPGVLEAGALVTVSGFSDANGGLRATLIDDQGTYQPGATLQIEGRVADLGGNRFRIGSLPIQYSAANITDGRPLATGDMVRVTGQRSTPDGPVMAQRIERAQSRLGKDGERVFVSGMASDIDGNRFTVAGQRVDASDAQRTGAVDTPLDNGSTISADGVRRGKLIKADTVRIESAPDIALRARLGSIEGLGERVVLLGSEWTIKADTRYLDQTNADERGLRLDRLAAGDTIRAVGYAGADGVIMTRLDRVAADPEGNAMLAGPIEHIQSDGTRIQIGLAGTTVTADRNRTRFEDASGQGIDAGTFLDAAATGVAVEAEGPANGDRIDVARVVRLRR